MVDLVIPTIGRPSLGALLASLARAAGPRPGRIILVDDRRDRTSALPIGNHDGDLLARITVLWSNARGPAAARNTGWRFSRARWVAFVDDDVLLTETWLADLERDLTGCAIDVAATTGRIYVPLPTDRKPTDWERNVAGLASAQWITADCAYRRSDLIATGGFDERFPRAFREDSDLALRIVARGKHITPGSRLTVHPIRSAPWWISIALQAGNADDVLMDALHGKMWHVRANASSGAFPAHVFTVATAAAAFACTAALKPRVGAVAAAVWALLVLRFWWARFAAGPRTLNEALTLAATSGAIPFAAVFQHLRARLSVKQRLRSAPGAPRPTAAAVLFDRDGTLAVDVPFNGDPELVEAMPGTRAALQRLRHAGIATALVSNQAGIALGRLERTEVDRINARLEDLIGPVGPIFICPHDANAGCGCHKPAPGLIEAAARELGVCPQDCVVVGDVGADIKAAQAAGARAILVPTAATRREEIDASPFTALTITEAVEAVLAGVA